MTTPEEPLVQRAQAGDRAALMEMLTRHGPHVRNALAGNIPQRWQSVLSIDDVMQEAYTDAFLHIARFEYRGDGSFQAWLTTMAQRTLLDAVRLLGADKRGGRRPPAPLNRRDNEHSFIALIDTIADSTSAVSRKAAGREAIESLQNAIQQLPTMYLQVVQMYDLENRPIEEVAAAIKRSTGAAYMQRLRAHRMLAELMGTASNYFSQHA